MGRPRGGKVWGEMRVQMGRGQERQRVPASDPRIRSRRAGKRKKRRRRECSVEVVEVVEVIDTPGCIRRSIRANSMTKSLGSFLILGNSGDAAASRRTGRLPSCDSNAASPSASPSASASASPAAIATAAIATAATATTATATATAAAAYLGARPTGATSAAPPPPTLPDSTPTM